MLSTLRHPFGVLSHCGANCGTAFRLSILDWSDDVTFHYARIRSALERAGTPIGNMDLLIASHAVSEHSTLVTNHVRHFSHVPGLKIEVENEERRFSLPLCVARLGS
jgi:hypothetical protein